ncbi:MAG: HNH endonuclease [Rhodoferax sp.]|nr:HNH endonuclease [Rhodoferax sp.]
MFTPSIHLRPGVTNRNQWQGAERKNAVTPKIRKTVLARDDNTCASCGHRAMKWMHIHHIADEENDDLENLATLCPACHAVMHFGRSMQWGTLEIWKVDIQQVEIVRATREGIKNGQSLQEVNASFKLKRGRLAPNSMKWANNLLESMESEPRAELPEPLCAVFVEFSRWQLDV